MANILIKSNTEHRCIHIKDYPYNHDPYNLLKALVFHPNIINIIFIIIFRKQIA